MKQQETKEKFDLSEKLEKEKKNLIEEHKRSVKKLKQEMEKEEMTLQTELNQLVCIALPLTDESGLGTEEGFTSALSQHQYRVD